MNKKEFYVVEWSERQKSIHIQSVSRMEKMNLQNIVRGRDAGYVPIYFAETAEEANQFAEKVDTKLSRLAR